MTENVKVTKAAGIISAATLLSRIFGYVRDMVLAWSFGAGMASDAFFVAFRIPNLLRRLFAEGSLSIAFVPVFTEYYKNKGKAEAFAMAGSAMRLLSFLMAFIAIIGIIISPLIIWVIGHGFTDAIDKFELTVTLTRIMFPYIFFISLVALSMGILNVLGHFAAPALAPVMLNLAIIGSAVFISPHLEKPVIGLAIGVILGGALQLLLQIPFLIQKGFRFRQKVKLFHPGLKKIGNLMLPAVFGAAVYQINILIATLLASFLPEGSVSQLYYADRLVQFPLGIFGIAAATAVLPSLSRQAVDNNISGLKETFAYTIRLVLFITVPAMAGLIVLRTPVVALLFKRGAFGDEATFLTAYALLYYSLGLWAFSTVRIVVSTFYSLQDTKTPVRIAIIAVTANCALGLLLMNPMGVGGLALSTSLASILNLLLLILALQKKLGALKWREIIISSCKTAACSAIMALTVYMVSKIIIPVNDASVSSLFLGLTGCIITGIGIYFICAFLFKSSELKALFTMVIKK